MFEYGMRKIPFVTLKCEQCDKPFETPVRRMRVARFCGKECFYKHGSGVKARSIDEKRELFSTMHKPWQNGLWRCWQWNGTTDDNGYGIFTRTNGSRLAHRASWFFEHGELREEDFVLHECDNPSCVNPAHLFLGTQSDNIADMVSKCRHQVGEQRPAAKLKESGVREIRAMDGPHQKIADLFGVTRTVVTNIKNRKAWKHVV